MKKMMLLAGIIFLLGCNEDDSGKEAFSCIEPPSGVIQENNINLAVYQSLVNKKGFLSQIGDTFMKINDDWIGITQWNWINVPAADQVMAFKFKIGTDEYIIEKEQFIFNQVNLEGFGPGNYTFNVLMDNMEEDINPTDLRLNIWSYTAGECNDVIKN